MQFSASETRIMRFLKAGGCELQDSVRESHILLVGEQGIIAAARTELQNMCDKGLLIQEGQSLVLSGLARKAMKVKTKLQSHALPTTEKIETSEGDKYTINPAESPLAILYRRKKADGETFISDNEFQAGERLRADFTRGSLMPSMTMRWDMGMVGGGQGGPGGMAELNDIALASRMRVERALEAVGPELSGVLIDVCCFLKGLEQVERERRWPVRSAKMMLKVGLSILHRHYDPPHEDNNRRGVVLHWGADDYRPKARPQAR